MSMSMIDIDYLTDSALSEIHNILRLSDAARRIQESTMLDCSLASLPALESELRIISNLSAILIRACAEINDLD